MKIYNLFGALAIAGLIGFSGVAQAGLNDGLVAYYPFNGNANDESGNGNNGTVDGATLTEDRNGNVDSAYSFDGVNDYIKVFDSESLELTNNFSICSWFKLDSLSQNYYMIFNKELGEKPFEGDWWMAIQSSSDKLLFANYPIEMESGGIIIQNDNTIEIGTWSYTCLSYDNTSANYKFFINGTINSGSVNFEITDNLYNLYIGAQQMPNYLRNYFDGKIDDIRIYNRALSESEIKELYNGGSCPSLGGGFTQADIDNAIETCKIDPASCGITPDDGITQDDLEDAIESGKQYCIDNPASCGITPDDGIPQVDLNDGLVAYYPFDGNAYDFSGNENDGTVNGATLAEDRFGNAGSAYEFNGVDNYVEVADAPEFNFGTGNFSISYWIKSSSESIQMAIHKGGHVSGSGTSYWVRHNQTSGLITFWTGGTIGETGFSTNQSTATDGTWHHVLAIRNGNTMQLFLDSQFLESTTGVSRSVDTDQALIIGAQIQDNNFSAAVRGYIDDVRIYNRALSESEIQKLYNESPKCEGDNTEDNLASAKKEGRQECINNPASCGIDVSGGTPATVSNSLEIHVPFANYDTLLGTMAIWADFDFIGENDSGELLWKLSDYGAIE